MTSRSYAFPVREVAAAFVAVGTGASYLQAADRARVSAQRERLPGERGGALVAEWLDLFASVVIVPHVEREWPERSSGRRSVDLSSSRWARTAHAASHTPADS